MNVDVIGPVIVAVHVNVTANVGVADAVDVRAVQPTVEHQRPEIMAIDLTAGRSSGDAVHDMTSRQFRAGTVRDMASPQFRASATRCVPSRRSGSEAHGHVGPAMYVRARRARFTTMAYGTVNVDVIGPVIVPVHVNVTANVGVADAVDDRAAEPSVEHHRPEIMAIELIAGRSSGNAVHDMTSRQFRAGMVREMASPRFRPGAAPCVPSRRSRSEVHGHVSAAINALARRVTPSVHGGDHAHGSVPVHVHGHDYERVYDHGHDHVQGSFL